MLKGDRNSLTKNVHAETLKSIVSIVLFLLNGITQVRDGKSGRVALSNMGRHDSWVGLARLYCLSGLGRAGSRVEKGGLVHPIGYAELGWPGPWARGYAKMGWPTIGPI